ncbi:cholesterol 25-hydroxylase-like protein [Rhincodon typus]|uniref:cholesterol 25-hydroxylase-like protein n=1 Tax=Rhincodon typus TaxID=259920 RepID=UPI00202EDCD8|nr:cholesterol 25-hydroxylase-like protein [Rhincodon typus]
MSSAAGYNVTHMGAMPLEAALLLQPVWDAVRAKQQWIKSPFFPVAFSLGVYLTFCLPYIVLDLLATRLPFLRKYKIQAQNNPSLGMMASCVAQTLYNHLVYIFPLSVAHWYWRPVQLPPSAPELHRLLLDVTACLLLFDFQYFVWHLLHHRVPWLYRTFHKVHHKYTATFALTTEHSGAWETLSLGFFAAINPVILHCHPFTQLLFFICNIWLSVEDHSGYDLPWSTHRLVPFGLYGGAPHHDLHHMKFKTNYAPYFTHWDKLLGTYSTLRSKSR